MKNENSHRSFLSFILLGMMLLWSAIGFSQKPAYVLYNSKGKKVQYAQLLKQLKKQDVVLFGEYHNNPISHWLQYEVTADLHQARELTLGAEMFEADNQAPLTAYVEGRLDAAGLDTAARLWPNYPTDYAPLVNFAREHQLPFVATNIPRRYAHSVYKGGFEALTELSPQEKSWMAPLPIPFDPQLPTYQKILEMMGGSDHGGDPRLVMAQAIKDATMAHFIHEHVTPGRLFLHFNGTYHSDHYEGILWYLRQKDVPLNYMTITTVIQADVSRLEDQHKKRADFIICVDEHMTTTY